MTNTDKIIDACVPLFALVYVSFIFFVPAWSTIQVLELMFFILQ